MQTEPLAVWCHLCTHIEDTGDQLGIALLSFFPMIGVKSTQILRIGVNGFALSILREAY